MLSYLPSELISRPLFHIASLGANFFATLLRIFCKDFVLNPTLSTRIFVHSTPQYANQQTQGCSIKNSIDYQLTPLDGLPITSAVCILYFLFTCTYPTHIQHRSPRQYKNLIVNMSNCMPVDNAKYLSNNQFKCTMFYSSMLNGTKSA